MPYIYIPPPYISPADRLRQMAAAYQESCILAAGAELDVFTEILKLGNRISANRLADEIHADLRGLSVLLDALTAADFLVKSTDATESTYTVAEQYVDLLDSRSPATYIPLIHHLACIQRNWTQLAWVVKDGVLPIRPPSIRGAEQDGISFIGAMNSIAQSTVGPTMETLKAARVWDCFENKSVRFLDIGGASGNYTEAFLHALPNSEGTLFDLPVGIAAACKRFGGTGLEPRVRLVEGDFYRDSLPEAEENGTGGFDFVWISAIIHQHGLEQTKELFSKAFRVMAPGGTIAIRDFVMSRDRTAPKEGAYFGINMLVNTETGMVYTLEECEETLQAAGFVNVRYPIRGEKMTSVVVAKKP